jgi:hypothetical protein
MKAVEPVACHEGGLLLVFAKDQPEDYDPLPASVDRNGLVMTEWLPSAVDLANLVNGGRVRIWLHHTEVQKGRPLTPMSVETTEGEGG